MHILYHVFYTDEKMKNMGYVKRTAYFCAAPPEENTYLLREVAGGKKKKKKIINDITCTTAA